MKIKIKADTTIKQISIWNGIFDLTKKELEVLSNLIDAEELLQTDNIADIENKKIAAVNMGISDYNTLNNYIKKFKDKKVISKSDNNYKLNSFLNPETDSVTVNIKKI